MKKQLLIIMLIVLLGGVLCSAEFKNEKIPVKGKITFQFQQVWTLDQAGENPLVNAASIKIDEDGTIYLVDPKFYYILAFSSEGKFLRSYGQRGEGPGEFRNPYQVFIKGRYVIGVDNGNRMNYFLKEGKFRNSFNPGPQIAPRGMVDIFRYVALRSDIEKSQKIETMEIIDLRNGKIKQLAQLTASKRIETTHGSGRNAISVKMTDSDITTGWVFGVNGNSIFYGRNDNYFIKKIDADGKELFSFSVNGKKRLPVPQEYKDKTYRELTSMAKVPSEVANRIIAGLPRVSTFFNKIIVDKNDLIYVYITDLTNKTGQDFDIFSSKGEYLYNASFNLPDGLVFASSIAIDGENAVVFVEDEDGEQQLAKYKITNPIQNQ